ncbi:MAG: hypothetical protein GX275_10100 [Clostridiales bacterium]|nr:hypothetical protein [Clostridiales bacterium]
MFGYITPIKDELKVSDFELFQSYYCSLCHSIKDVFGHIPRFFLNYDSTFFIVLLDGLNKSSGNTRLSNCIKYPFTKKNILVNSKILNYITEFNIALTYFKILDDCNDEKKAKNIYLRKIIKPFYTKIKNKNIITSMERNLDFLNSLENNKSFYSIDYICHPFSSILGEIFKEAPIELDYESYNNRELLYSLGYSLGKWIYLIDALDDLKEDKDSNRFNPILSCYNTCDVSTIKEIIEFQLVLLIDNCKNAVNKLSLIKNNDLILNVIDLGLPSKNNYVLSKI